MLRSLAAVPSEDIEDKAYRGKEGWGGVQGLS